MIIDILPSITDMAENTGLAERTIYKLLVDFKKSGLFIAQEKHHKYLTIIYHSPTSLVETLLKPLNKEGKTNKRI